MGQPSILRTGSPTLEKWVRVCNECSKKWLLQDDQEFCARLLKEFVHV